MRRVWLLLPLLTCTGATAFAQVTVDLHALDGLPSSNAQPSPPLKHYPAPRRVVAAKPKTPAPEQATVTPPTGPTASIPANPPAATTPSPPPADLPTAPPPTVALAPITPPPPAATAPPQAPPMTGTAASSATTSGANLSVTFGSGQSDLSPSSASAIQNLVKTTPTDESTSFNVVAYAAGTPEDPSTARRLSLSRALAVRSALMADGISSSRIYVRALGAETGDKTPDRVDVAVLGANAASATKGAQP